MTGRRRLALASGTMLVAIISAGCGSSDGVGVADPGSSTGPSTGSTASPSVTGAGATALTVTVTDQKTSTWTLTCGAGRPGGTLAHPDQACAVLMQNGAAALPPVAAGVACSEIYGGPQTATIEGTFNGTPVSSSFNRTNGCEVSRWEKLIGVLPSVRGAGSAPHTMSYGPGHG